MEMAKFCRKLVQELVKGNVSDIGGFEKVRNRLLREFKPSVFPSMIQVLAHADDAQYAKLRFLQTKPTRTIAGVAPIAIMTAPFPCPHGKCLMCPGGLGSEFGDTPQSYTGREPAAMRAARNFHDPYLQVFNRLEQYTLLNQSSDKVELILMGGTFIALEKEYREDFVKYAFKAMNDFGEMFLDDFGKFKEFFELPADVNDKERTARVQKKILALKGECSLEEEKERNETSKVRCVTMCIETRADFGKLEHGNEMLRLGCTRVEIGIQSVYDEALLRINRGHTVEDTKESIRILKDLGFKVAGHYMPGLPGISKEKDLIGMKKLFEDPDYRPDMLKIYPCMVMKGTRLYEEWKKGDFKPLATDEATKLIVEFKRFVPKYCRIVRVLRDIPTYLIEAGIDRTNLRQYVDILMKKKNIKCNCIRCREIGRRLKQMDKIQAEEIEIITKSYDASKGVEYFISVEDIKNNILLGYCRLRLPSQFLRPEINDKTALIRELHIYSPVVAIGHKSNLSYQHRGLGKRLLKRAEEIAKINSKGKIVVISGIGVRKYFAKLEYFRDGPYMSKILD